MIISCNIESNNLNIFELFINLEILNIGNKDEDRIEQGIYNHFYGSLEPLKKLTKLWLLDIDNTDINSGVDFLPKSLKEISYFYQDRLESKIREIADSLKQYGTLEMINQNKQLSMNQASRIPLFININERTVESNIPINQINYDKIYPEFPWNINQNNITNLPLRLYNIKKDNKNFDVKNIEKLKENVEEARERKDIKNYATLSYVWGKVENKDELTVLGRNSLTKAVETCKLLDIDYLWIDQLCINQKDRDEKADEVRKMRKCYNDCFVTLVSIEKKIGSDLVNKLIKNSKIQEDKLFYVHSLFDTCMKIINDIVNSQWFSRSWTFQEGWLSRQTIFMFNDFLIDGRILAAAWVDRQPVGSFSGSNEGIHNFNKYLFKNIGKASTPIGWAYNQNGYDQKDEVILSLNQALRETKIRGRGIPIDGIYSILGLLPYGEKIKVEYKDRDHLYTKDEILKVLFNVMKIAMDSGYGEPFSWNWPSSGIENFSWLPQVNEKTGSFDVKGGIEIDCKEAVYNFTNKGVEVIGFEYIIESSVGGVKGVDSTNTVDGGLSMKDFLVIVNDTLEKITFQGTRQAIEKVKKGHSLITINNWKTIKKNNIDDFALLVEIGVENYRYRIDLINFYKEDKEKLIGLNEKKFIICNNDNIEKNKEINSELKFCIEVNN